MTRAFEPQNWAPERLNFAAFKILALLLSARRGRASGPQYDQFILVRKPGRNQWESYSLAAVHAALYAAAAVSLLSAAGVRGWWLLAALPLILVLTFVLVMGTCIPVGLLAGVVNRLTGVETLRAATVLNTVAATATAVLLLLRDHWTRYAGQVWLGILAANMLAAVIAPLLRGRMAAASARLGRESQSAE